MNKKLKLLIISLFIIILSITTVYAATIIASKDIIYDNTKSGSRATDIQGAIDDLYKKAKSCNSGSSDNSANLINYVKTLAVTDKTNLAYDETTDNNLRYIGKSPNNYVEFNGEKWRIIGVMNNIEDANKNKASHVKIIRAESIGTIAYNSSNINDWSTASLQKLLNSGDYYNRVNSYANTGLTTDAKSMISNVVWNLGGHQAPGVLTPAMYTAERGTTVYEDHATIWIGYIGLVYPSDYGYAVGGSLRNQCIASTGLYYYSNEGCYNNDWLYKDGTYQWTLSPNSASYHQAFGLVADGREGNQVGVNTLGSISPVVYLNINVKVTGGEGTEDKPYIISS